MDEGVSASRDTPASTSRESDSEPPEKSGIGKHSISTHFPKDLTCKVRKRTKITRAPCRKRTGDAVLGAEDFGDLITAEHKGLSEGCSSTLFLPKTSHDSTSLVRKFYLEYALGYASYTWGIWKRGYFGRRHGKSTHVRKSMLGD